jgi:hypothetical protein
VHDPVLAAQLLALVQGDAQPHCESCGCCGSAPPGDPVPTPGPARSGWRPAGSGPTGPRCGATSCSSGRAPAGPTRLRRRAVGAMAPT